MEGKQDVELEPKDVTKLPRPRLPFVVGRENPHVLICLSPFTLLLVLLVHSSDVDALTFAAVSVTQLRWAPPLVHIFVLERFALSLFFPHASLAAARRSMMCL